MFLQVSACDARLTAFYGLNDATRCWIKGRQFSLAGLLADNSPGQLLASQFDDGCMMIFRLAPQVLTILEILITITTGTTLTAIYDITYIAIDNSEILLLIVVAI